MRHLQALEVVDVLISLRNQPPIWQPVLPAGQRDDVVLLVELVEQLLAAAQHVPGVVCCGMFRPNGTDGAEGEGRVLAEVVVGRGVADLDGAVLHGVEHLQARHDFAAGEDLDLELVVGHLGDDLGDHLGAAVDRVERLRKARRHAPFDFRHRLRDRRRRDGGGACNAYSGDLDEVTTFH